MAWTGRTPIHQFHKMAGNDLVTTPDFAAWVDSIEANAHRVWANSNTPSAVNPFVSFRSRGTFAAPSAVQSGDIAMLVEAWPWANGDYRAGAIIRAEVSGAPSGNNVPTDWRFYTSSAAAQVPERMRLTAQGNLRGISEDTYFAWDANGSPAGTDRVGIAKKSGQNAK